MAVVFEIRNGAFFVVENFILLGFVFNLGMGNIDNFVIDIFIFE